MTRLIIIGLLLSMTNLTSGQNSNIKLNIVGQWHFLRDGGCVEALNINEKRDTSNIEVYKKDPIYSGDTLMILKSDGKFIILPNIKKGSYTIRDTSFEYIKDFKKNVIGKKNAFNLILNNISYLITQDKEDEIILTRNYNKGSSCDFIFKKKK